MESLFIDRMNSAAKAALSSRLKRLTKETRRGVQDIGKRSSVQTTL